MDKEIMKQLEIIEKKLNKIEWTRKDLDKKFQ